jgi:hypothetical protein
MFVWSRWLNKFPAVFCMMLKNRKFPEKLEGVLHIKIEEPQNENNLYICTHVISVYVYVLGLTSYTLWTNPKYFKKTVYSARLRILRLSSIKIKLLKQRQIDNI